MNNYIQRVESDLSSYLEPGKVLVMYGARRTGKTTLAAQFLKESPYRNVLQVTGDDIIARSIFSSENRQDILDFTEGYDLLFIDEAQRIPKIGWGLKLLVDSNQNISVLATGSASFALAGELSEPLTGRMTEINLFPIALSEYAQTMPKAKLRQNLMDQLLYGMYPEILTTGSANLKRTKLLELTRAYLYKDILELDRIKNAKLLTDLLQLVSYQIGSELNVSELASRLSINQRTVQRYLDIFEKSFILFSVRGFSRNLRNEVTRLPKYYFYDVGIRNAVIQNFNPLSARNDIGNLFENFIISERIKKRFYKKEFGSTYFWRTYEKKEIDLVENVNGNLSAFEIKYNENAKVKKPMEFLKTYPDATFEIINGHNYLDYLL